LQRSTRYCQFLAEQALLLIFQFIEIKISRNSSLILQKPSHFAVIPNQHQCLEGIVTHSAHAKRLNRAKISHFLESQTQRETQFCASERAIENVTSSDFFHTKSVVPFFQVFPPFKRAKREVNARR
jgi:hypothetical protein